MNYGGVSSEPAAALYLAAAFALQGGRASWFAAAQYACPSGGSYGCWYPYTSSLPPTKLRCDQLRSALQVAAALAPRLGYGSTEQARCEGVAVRPARRPQLGCCPIPSASLRRSRPPRRWPPAPATRPCPRPGWIASCTARSCRPSSRRICATTESVPCLRLHSASGSRISNHCLCRCHEARSERWMVGHRR